VVREIVPEFGQDASVGPDRIFLGVHLVVIQEQVDGLGYFHAPPPVFDGIMLMLMNRRYHNFLRNSDEFL